MNELIRSFVEKRILRHFLNIGLSDAERHIYTESLQNKIIPSINMTLVISLCTIPAILFLDNTILVSVLIPITMVSGTAWFAISVANIKKKFELFALELITSMYKSFSCSLSVLLLLAMFSLLQSLTTPLTLWGNAYPVIQMGAGAIGLFPMVYIIWHLYIGALKYDINDSMLAGQHEVAERYYKDTLFKRSLYLLHNAVEKLRDGKSLPIANYYLGLAFAELFTYLHAYILPQANIKNALATCHALHQFPNKPQTEADALCVELIQQFMNIANTVGKNSAVQKHMGSIKDELNAIQRGNEEQAMVDSRMATILEEIAEILKLQFPHI